jgi:hypothetical protein
VDAGALDLLAQEGLGLPVGDRLDVGMQPPGRERLARIDVKRHERRAGRVAQGLPQGERVATALAAIDADDDRAEHRPQTVCPLHIPGHPCRPGSGIAGNPQSAFSPVFAGVR